MSTTSIPEFRAELQAVMLAASETKVFRFRIVNAPNWSFAAGQFISIRIEEKLFRAYSLASSPGALPDFELCAKIIPGGAGSTYLDALQPGDQITFRGPFGRFLIRDSSRGKLFIGTGTGIAPLKCFVDEFASGAYGTADHALVFGVRTQSYATYLHTFQKVAESHPNFRFVLCLSQPEAQDRADVNGRVTDWLRQQPVPYFQNKDIYLCGSPPMVKEATELLLGIGVEKEAIRTEAY